MALKDGVPSFTEVQMRHRKGFRFVDIETFPTGSVMAKRAQEKEKAGKAGTEMLLFTPGFAKQSPHPAS